MVSHPAPRTNPGDGEMEWEEFMSFIIEEAIVSNDNNEAELIGEFMFDTPAVAPRTPVQYVADIPGADKFLACEEAAIRIMSSKDFTLLRTLVGHRGRVLAALPADPERFIVSVGEEDQAVALWDRDTYALESAIYLEHVPACMVWVPSPAGLFIGTTEGFLYHLKVLSGPTPEAHQVYLQNNLHPNLHKFGGSHHLEVISLRRHHQLPITALGWAASLQYVITGSAAGTANIIPGQAQHVEQTPIKGYSPLLADAVEGPDAAFRLTGQHPRGIHTIAVHAPGVVITAGDDPKPRVWDLNTTKLGKPTSLQTSGHHHPLTLVVSISTRQVVTFDVKGVVKVWDTTVNECIQTLHLPGSAQARAGYYNPKGYRVVLATTRGVATLTSDAAADPWRADSRGVAGALYSTVAATFAVWCGARVKFWSGGAGEQCRHIDVGTPLNCMCLDKRERKLLLGGDDGGIRVHNYNTGAFMKTFTPYHNAEISSLHYVELETDNGSNIDRRVWVISSSWDGTVHVYDDETVDGSHALVRKLDTTLPADPTRPPAEVTAVAVSTNVSLLVTGDSTGYLKVSDLESGSLEGVLHHLDGVASDITACIFLDPLPVLASFDSVGFICLWSVRPAPVVNQLLACFKHGRPQVPCSLIGSDPTDSSESMAIKRAALQSPAPMRKRSQSRLAKGRNTASVAQQRPGAQTPFSMLFAAAQDSAARLSCGLGAAFDPEELLLYVGDDEGAVTAYDLSSFAHDAGLTATGYSRANRRAHPPLTVQFPDKETFSRVPGGRTSLITVDKQWMAHRDAVVSIALIDAPKAIVTASLDGTALVWSRQGGLLAALQQGVTPDRRQLLDVEAEDERKKQEMMTKIRDQNEKKKRRKAALRRALVMTALTRDRSGDADAKQKREARSDREEAEELLKRAFEGETIPEEDIKGAVARVEEADKLLGDAKTRKTPKATVKSIFKLTTVDAPASTKPAVKSAPDTNKRVPWAFVPDRTVFRAAAEKNIDTALEYHNTHPALPAPESRPQTKEEERTPTKSALRRSRRPRDRMPAHGITDTLFGDSLVSHVQGMPDSVREAAAKLAETVADPPCRPTPAGRVPPSMRPGTGRTPLSSWQGSGMSRGGMK